MWRRTAVMVLMIAMCLSIGQMAVDRVDAFGAQPALVSLFGVRVEGAVLFEGRAFVPAKALHGVLGLNLDFDSRTQTLQIGHGLDSPPGDSPLPPYKGHAVVRVIVNNVPQTLNPPAINHRGTVYVPLRLLERLGVHVGWDLWSNTAYAGTRSAATLPRVGTTRQLELLLGNRQDWTITNGRRSSAMTTEQAA